MTKSKTVVSLSLILILGGYILYNQFFSSEVITIKHRNVTNNPAEKVTLEEGISTVGVDLKVGFYDVKNISKETVIVNGNVLKMGDQLINQIYYNRSEITIEGKGKVLFSPSKFSILTPNKKGEIEIESTSEYVVGTDLPVGDYSITASQIDSSKNGIYVQILTSFNISNELVDSIQFNSSNEKVKVHLKQGELVQIIKDSFNNEPNDSKLIIVKD